MSNTSQIETPLLKVPYESLKKAAKERKAVVDEAARALSGISNVAQETSLTKERTSAHLGSLVEKLTNLKRKLDEVCAAERESVERAQARFKYLVDLGEPLEENVVQWNTGRMDRLLADYFLRGGYSETARTIAESSNIDELVDSQIFKDAYIVIEGLKNCDCSEALLWCAENRYKLKKIRSKLEFKLHLQVFIEFVRANKMMQAIKYAQSNLAPWAPQHMEELQRVIATIAFQAHTDCQRYKELFLPERWDIIIEEFHEALYRLNSLTSQSLLSIHLQAGLSALKTPHSYEPVCCQEDPLHLPSFQKLAEGLPFAKYDRSRLICSITKEIMNADNPPKALPNGYVYSTKAIEQLKDVHGKITCPFTGEVCEESEVRRVFIV